MASGPPSKPVDLKTRTRQFTLRIMRLYGVLPKTNQAQVVGKQLLRSGTSVGAHYREAVRARSNAEFVSKLQAGLQELEESMYWMELIVESGVFDARRMKPIMAEAGELTAILTACVKKARGRGARTSSMKGEGQRMKDEKQRTKRE